MLLLLLNELDVTFGIMKRWIDFDALVEELKSAWVIIELVVTHGNVEDEINVTFFLEFRSLEKEWQSKLAVFSCSNVNVS